MLKKIVMLAGIAALPALTLAQSPAELAIAASVYQGRLPCELGAYVTVTADPRAPGFFDVEIKKQKFRMFPVVTTTGAVRLEDRQAGAVWLQVSNKSMLMNQKLGKRLADACMSPEQAAVTESLRLNPAPQLLDLPVSVATK